MNAKFCVAFMLAAASVGVMRAESYNRIGVSLNMNNYWFNKAARNSSYGSDFSMFGPGIEYAHGFGVAKNMFVETGLSVALGFGDATVMDSWSGPDAERPGYHGSYDSKTENSYSNLYLEVPVNYVYRFQVGDKVSLMPFAGIYFRANCFYFLKEKENMSWRLTSPDGTVATHEYNNSSDWYNLSANSNWNVYQMGWQAGLGARFGNWSVTAQYGTGFLNVKRNPKEMDGIDTSAPGYKKTRITQGTFRLSLGYFF